MKESQYGVGWERRCEYERCRPRFCYLAMPIDLTSPFFCHATHVRMMDDDKVGCEEDKMRLPTPHLDPPRQIVTSNVMPRAWPRLLYYEARDRFVEVYYFSTCFNSLHPQYITFKPHPY